MSSASTVDRAVPDGRPGGVHGPLRRHDPHCVDVSPSGLTSPLDRAPLRPPHRCSARPSPSCAAARRFSASATRLGRRPPWQRSASAPPSPVEGRWTPASQSTAASRAELRRSRRRTPPVRRLPLPAAVAHRAGGPRGAPPPVSTAWRSAPPRHASMRDQLRRPNVVGSRPLNEDPTRRSAIVSVYDCWFNCAHPGPGHRGLPRPVAPGTALGYLPPASIDVAGPADHPRLQRGDRRRRP